MSGCAAKLFAVLAPSADTAAVMCAYGGQLPIVTPFIVGCVGAYTPKRIPTEEKYLAMARRFAVSANHVCQDARTELRGQIDLVNGFDTNFVGIQSHAQK